VGFWECLYLVALGCLAVLWRPSKISPRANYVELSLPQTDSLEGIAGEDEELEDLEDLRHSHKMATRPQTQLRKTPEKAGTGNGVELLEMGHHESALDEEFEAAHNDVAVSSDEELSEF